MLHHCWWRLFLWMGGPDAPAAPTSPHCPHHAVPQGWPPKPRPPPAAASMSAGKFATPSVAPWLLQDREMLGTGKLWGGQCCPLPRPPAPGSVPQHPAGPQPVDQHLPTPLAASSDGCAACQGTNATPPPFFKRLNIKRPKCSSYFSVNVAAKYSPVDVACKTKAIDNVISPGEPLRHRISFTFTETRYPRPPAQRQGSALHPCTQDLLGFAFPFSGLFMRRKVNTIRFGLLLSLLALSVGHGSMGQGD